MRAIGQGTSPIHHQADADVHHPLWRNRLSPFKSRLVDAQRSRSDMSRVQRPLARVPALRDVAAAIRLTDLGHHPLTDGVVPPSNGDRLIKLVCATLNSKKARVITSAFSGNDSPAMRSMSGWEYCACTSASRYSMAG
ncbi:hypothetical protein [Actinomyces sp. 594]|uniref:hypothetical protein n=1 Tax=Actinomyces sp. 594 TaxID=2057793 RepID=UPI00214C5311|nr:hypothetical protein [Actinomyces sp. 594]